MESPTWTVKYYCTDCNNAKKKFRRGDKVVLSVDGCKSMPELIKNKLFGTVVGFSRLENCVLIKFNSLKKPQSFHCGFWERV